MDLIQERLYELFQRGTYAQSIDTSELHEEPQKHGADVGIYCLNPPS